MAAHLSVGLAVKNEPLRRAESAGSSRTPLTAGRPFTAGSVGTRTSADSLLMTIGDGGRNPKSAAKPLIAARRSFSSIALREMSAVDLAVSSLIPDASQRPPVRVAVAPEPKDLRSADAARLDPSAQRLFVEPKFHAPPRRLSPAEASAERRRQLGPEGSIARTIADERAAEVGVLPVADQAAAALRRLPAFRHFSDESLSRLARLGRLQRRARYQHFFHEGSKADALYILVSGTVRLVAGGDQSTGREIKPPTVFGLEALAALDPELAGGEGTERLEGAVALRPSVCIRIQGEFIRSAIAEMAAATPFFSFDAPPGGGRNLVQSR